MSEFERMESEVRSYCRCWPAVFEKAQGSWMYDESGGSYLDFFAGAGALNYGHNHPDLKAALIAYLESDGVAHTLDMYSAAKRDFLVRFKDTILEPRGLDYKVQFPGPAGANSVEAALKLARKVTGRETVVSFTNAFHGMTLGALALAGNPAQRASAGLALGGQIVMPFDGYLDRDGTSLQWLESVLAGRGTGLPTPAAVILETVQADGGVNVARSEWLREVAALFAGHGVLLITDEVQVGCGRTGPFFSFEEAGIVPDIVTLSKSLSGYGLPLALTLMRPDLDVWSPGQHNGTFRGCNPSFVTATAALAFWSGSDMERTTKASSGVVQSFLENLREESRGQIVAYRGRGLIWGVELHDTATAATVCREAYARGLLVEAVGPADQVVKISPPLTIKESELRKGLEILADVVKSLGAAARSGEREGRS
jgi:diaminobutyrate--2-oxoglutarate aminotransferase